MQHVLLILSEVLEVRVLQNQQVTNEKWDVLMSIKNSHPLSFYQIKVRTSHKKK